MSRLERNFALHIRDNGVDEAKKSADDVLILAMRRSDVGNKVTTELLNHLFLFRRQLHLQTGALQDVNRLLHVS